MDNQKLDVVELEEIPESFVCCVCLDLLYKPIVLSCGHISCFWCVHYSMNSLRESHCPICRNPYTHFPTICQMLHCLLQKMYPIAYRRRELQTLEEEKICGYSSPQFDANPCCSSLAEQDVYLADNSACESCANTKQSEPRSQVQDSCLIIPEKAPHGNYKVTGTVTGDKKNFPKDQHGGNLKQVTVEDVLCVRCKQLLFRPMVLNCGHVYCESCLVDLCQEIIKCQVCQNSHPKGILKVCLELNQFLEQCFPKEYALRRDAAQLKQINFDATSLNTCLEKASKQARNGHWWTDPHLNVHIGVGCDYCGICPIIGNRYRCKDCKEKIGFDLCGDCYNTTSKLPGRFNQQHTPEHQFELMESNTIHNIMLRLVPAQIEDGSTTLVIGNYSHENSEDGSTPHSFSGRVHENVENSSAAPASSTSGEEEEEENQVDNEPVN